MKRVLESFWQEISEKWRSCRQHDHGVLQNMRRVLNNSSLEIAARRRSRRQNPHSLFQNVKRFLKIFLLFFVALPLASFAVFMCFVVFRAPPPPPNKTIISDVTKLNPFAVSGVVTPRTNEDVQNAVRAHRGPISIGGGRYSMGGQIGTDGTLFIDMQKMNRILAFDPKQKRISVQAGARWKDIQAYVDHYNLSVKIMQTYDNFTVGGSLSVNVHGRYVGLGPLILSVHSFKIVLANGTLVEASPDSNAELFFGAIGGYGGLGVITEATLDLADNVSIGRQVETMPIAQYKNYFFNNIRNSADAVFHNADIYPPEYERVNAVTWTKTNQPLTDSSHFKPVKNSYWLENFFYYWITELPLGRYMREHVLDPWLYREPMTVKRNYEASYDVAELMPLNRDTSAYILQEYFIPIEKFDAFVPRMRTILQDHHVNMVNISIRHARKDPGAVMAWAREEVFAFVMYYKEGTSVEDREATGVWTREMIDAATSLGGSYYLPYQLFATQKQFMAAYPDAEKLFALKQKYDPTYTFRNKLWDKYYLPDQKDRDLAQQAEDNKDYSRTEDQTFLTIPEWYLVFSSDEYANALKHRPSDFPYFGSIFQFWDIYGLIKQRTDREYASNPGYRLMDNVIGTSTAAELFFKGIYENTIGRLTEWISGHRQLTPDMKVESFMQATAADYVTFIRKRPWYEYPFFARFEGLWRVRESSSTSIIRSVERRLFFSGELLFKSGYGWVINKATEQAYEAPEAETTWTLVDRDGSKALVPLPRYQAFTPAAMKEAQSGSTFLHIAGNGKILVTVIAPKSWRYQGSGEVFTEWPILTEPDKKRSALVLNVQELSPFLLQLKQGSEIKLDHIFDY